MTTQGRVALFHCDGGRLVASTPESAPRCVEAFYLPCTGRLPLSAVLEEVRAGASRVLVCGCPEHLCRFPHPDGCPAQRVAQAGQALCSMLGSPAVVTYHRIGTLAEANRLLGDGSGDSAKAGGVR